MISCDIGQIVKPANRNQDEQLSGGSSIHSVRPSAQVLSLEVDMIDRDQARAVLIFGSYLIICASLTALIGRDLLKRWRSIRNTANGKKRPLPKPSTGAAQISLASAAVCLGITWYHMLSFFSLSYRVWAVQHGIKLLAAPQSLAELISWMQAIHLGQWLKDVKLFREAWEVAMETPARLFWSQPIFFITAAWSFYVGRQGRHSQVRLLGYEESC